jgi:hypothetical protein
MGEELIFFLFEDFRGRVIVSGQGSCTGLIAVCRPEEGGHERNGNRLAIPGVHCAYTWNDNDR